MVADALPAVDFVSALVRLGCRIGKKGRGMIVVHRGIATLFVPDTVLAPPIMKAMLREVGVDTTQFLGALGH